MLIIFRKSIGQWKILMAMGVYGVGQKLYKSDKQIQLCGIHKLSRFVL